MSTKNLKEKFAGHALITGGSAGLGAEFARQLAEKGMDIVLVARRKEKMEELASEIQSKFKVQVEVIVQDLSTMDCADKIKAELDSKKISVGLLVNNAGYGTYGYFHEIEPKSELQMIDLNVRTPVALTHAFLPEMVKRKKGGVIFLASNGAYQPCPFFATYGATKAFNLMLGEALWGEYREFGIEVISLSPGYTRTEFQDVAGNKGQEPLGGWSEPKEVVKQCLDNLGSEPSTIPGLMNSFLAWSMRFTPRKMAVLVGHSILKPKK
ncbi:MAG: SDR family oxidoreductase [Leptospiraceae bacterium]|nr:SDR family oxidoreductase [Leptospiraceae bacterium]